MHLVQSFDPPPFSMKVLESPVLLLHDRLLSIHHQIIDRFHQSLV
jgi:hypothetical protein